MEIKILTTDEAMKRLANLEETKDVYVIVYNELFERRYMEQLRDSTFTRVTDPTSIIIEFVKSGD